MDASSIAVLLGAPFCCCCCICVCMFVCVFACVCMCVRLGRVEYMCELCGAHALCSLQPVTVQARCATYGHSIQITCEHLPRLILTCRMECDLRSRECDVRSRRGTTIRSLPTHLAWRDRQRLRGEKNRGLMLQIGVGNLVEALGRGRGSLLCVLSVYV